MGDVKVSANVPTEDVLYGPNAHPQFHVTWAL